MKYKVNFSGFAYVEADSEEEAREKVLYEDDAIYSETQVDNIEELYKIRSPILCQLNIKGNMHFVVIYKIKNDIFTIMDPSQGKITMDKWEFLDIWTGYIMIFEPIRKLPVTIDNKFLNKIIWTLLFKNKKLGYYTMYATDINELILIRTDRKTYVFSCKDRNKFIESVKLTIIK